MREIETYKKPQGIFQHIGFFLKHETTPSLAERARTVCLANHENVRFLIDSGLLTIERLIQIDEDPGLQEKYRGIMKEIRDGTDKTDSVLGLKTDELAGWLLFFRNYYESHWNIKLLTDEERTL